MQQSGSGSGSGYYPEDTLSPTQLMAEHVDEDFHAAFGEVLQGTLDAFIVEEIKDDTDDLRKSGGLEDISRIHLAEAKLVQALKRDHEFVDAARNDLRAISRAYEQQRLSAVRPSGIPSAAEHEARITAAHFDRITKMKEMQEVEQQLFRMQGERERIQQELKEEEADAYDVSELNGEVLRLKVYRGFGLTPVEENGAFAKVLARSRRSQHAVTAHLKAPPKQNDFYSSNFLWDALSV